MSSRHPQRGQRDEHRDSRERDPAPAPRRGGDRRGGEYWISSAGIEREVIQADICRYLGRDALVRPFPNPDTREPGYLISAYRDLTSAMIEDLKRDSNSFVLENRAKRAAGYRPVSYDQSDTYADAYDDSRIPTSRPPTHPSFPHRGQDQYMDPGYGQIYSQPQQQHPTQANYIVERDSEYGNLPRSNMPPQGSPGGQYQYEPRQAAYNPRTTQPQDDPMMGVRDTRNPRDARDAPMAYGVPYTAAPQFTNQPAPSQRAYIDPATGRTVYLDPSEYEPRSRVTQPNRGDRDHGRRR